MAKAVLLKRASYVRSTRYNRSWRMYAIISVAAFAVVTVIGTFFPKLPSSRSVMPISAGDVRVIDGDTVSYRGKTYRLVGFDTPETSRAKCDRERTLGAQAAVRLRALISSADITLQEVRCSCVPGTEGSRYCNFGRLCGLLKRNGENVGDILIREQFARPFLCREFHCPKRPGWCSGLL